MKIPKRLKPVSRSFLRYLKKFNCLNDRKTETNAVAFEAFSGAAPFSIQDGAGPGMGAGPGEWMMVLDTTTCDTAIKPTSHHLHSGSHLIKAAVI